MITTIKSPPAPKKEPLEKLFTIKKLREVFEVEGMSKRMREHLLNISDNGGGVEVFARIPRYSTIAMQTNEWIEPSSKITTCSGMIWSITLAGERKADMIRKFNRAMDRRSAEILRRKEMGNAA